MSKVKVIQKGEVPVKTVEAELMMDEADFSNLPVAERKAAETRYNLKQAVRKIKSNFADIGKNLLVVKESSKVSPDGVPYWKGWGFESFADYIEEELDMNFRAGYQIMSVAAMVRDYNLEWDQITSIGWTKCALVARQAEIDVEKYEKPKEEVKEKVKDNLVLASEMSVPRLKEVLKSSAQAPAVGGGEATEEGQTTEEGTKKTDSKDFQDQKHKITWLLEGQDSKTFEMALAIAAQAFPHLKTDKEMVAAILGDWMELREAMPEGLPLDVVVSRIEKTYGVKPVSYTHL